MELTISRDDALAAVSRVQGACARGAHVIPILAHVLLSADRGQLAIRCADTELQAATTVQAEVASPGQTTVPVDRFHGMLRSLPPGAQVHLKLDGARMIARCARTRFQMPTLQAEGFPVLEMVEVQGRATIKAATLARMIDRTAFAISSEVTRYWLCGLYLAEVVVDGVRRLRAVATDGNRLAFHETPEGEGWTVPVIVPAKAVRQLRQLVDGRDCAVEICTDGRSLFVASIDGTEIVSVLVEGSYPDYPRVIPRDAREIVELDVGDTLGALKRCALAALSKSKPVTLTFGPASVEFKARDGDGGEVEDQVEAVGLKGPEVTLGFAGPYLTQALEVMGERARLAIGGPNDAMKILDPADDMSMQVLMPLRF